MAWSKTGNIQGPPGTSSITFTAVKTAAYTAVLGDANKCVPFNLSAAANFSIPTNASVAFPIGTELPFRQVGTFAVTAVAVTPGTTTIRSPNGVATTGQGDWRMAVKYDTDIWDIL